MNVKLPEKLVFIVTENARNKVAYGGRGAGKSYAYADSLLVKSMQFRKRILCARELQNSIKDSVHRLLQDRIAFHEVQNQFEVTDQEIRHLSTGSNFIFKGLRTNTSEIKSMEGIDICWVEEAQKVSQDSIDLLTPTIRNPDSEIWWSFNTGSDSDPVYKMFVVEGRPNSIVTLVNYYDNPWFPDVLRQEMEYDRQYNPDRYRHVWLGEPGAEGTFFHEFGPHLKEDPFPLEQSECMGQLFLSLDHGTSHPTSAGLWWVSPLMDKWYKRFGEHYSKHRVMSYYAQGLSTGENAQELFRRIESFPHTHGVFPRICWYDPSMDTKVRKDQYTTWAPIDEYKGLLEPRGVRFEPANNNKEHGCMIMREDFRVRNGIPGMRYWTPYNGTYETGIKRVVADDNNTEIYAKMDGDDCCFVAGTLIITDAGEKPIECLNVGDTVLTRQGFKKIVNKFIRIDEVGYWNNTYVTPNHPIILANGEIKKVCDLMPPDTILLTKGGVVWLRLFCIMGLCIAGILTAKVGIIGNIFMEAIRGVRGKAQSICIGLFGKRVMGQLGRVGLFIIWMATRLIMTFGTLRFCLRVSIMAIMLKHANTVNQRRQKSILRIFEIRPKRGMLRKRGENGTKGITTKSRIDYTGIFKESAIIVGKLMFVRILDIFAFVLISANRLIGEPPDSTILKRPVLFVGKYLSVINTKKYVHVVESVKTFLYQGPKKKDYVYNITVEDANEYFANGILVHNCDESRYGQVGLRSWLANETSRKHTMAAVAQVNARIQGMDWKTL